MLEYPRDQFHGSNFCYHKFVITQEMRPWQWCWRHLFHQIHGMLRCNSCILGCIKSHRHLKFIELCHDLYSWIGKHWNNVMGSRINEYTNTVWGASDARFRCFYWANLQRGSYVGHRYCYQVLFPQDSAIVQHVYIGHKILQKHSNFSEWNFDPVGIIFTDMFWW